MNSTGSVGRESNMDLFLIAGEGCGGGVAVILWIIATILVIGGIVTLVRDAVLYGIVLIIVGLLIGPGGVSIFCWAAAPGLLDLDFELRR
jgi:hypothetical protein